MSKKSAFSLILILAIITKVFSFPLQDIKSPISDVKVEIASNSLVCDDLVCPESTIVCTINKRTDAEDMKKLVVVRKCFDKDNVVVAENSQILLNENPTENINFSVESNGNYMITRREDDYDVQRALLKKIHETLEEKLHERFGKYSKLMLKN